MQRDLRELGPTALLAPPRIWENMLTAVQVRAADAAPLKRRVFELLPRRRGARRRSSGPRASRVPLGLRLKLRARRVLRLPAGARPARPAPGPVGLHRRGAARAGHLPLLPRHRREPQADLRLHRDRPGWSRCSRMPRPIPPPRAGPCPGIEVQIGDRGEVLVKSPGIFKGYFKNDEATREVIDRRGLVPHRRRRLPRPARPPGHHRPRQGRRAPCRTAPPSRPQFIENKLKFSPYIREAVAFGNERPFVAAMIAIDLNTVGNWAERRGLAYTALHGPQPRRRRSGRLIREEIRQGQRDAAGGHRRSGASSS